MSTTYYPLREPFTEIAHIEGCTILLFIAGAEVGRIVVPDDDAPTVLRLFADRDHPIRSNMRGTSAAHYLPDSVPLISEYGEVVTLGFVRRGRK